MSIESSYIGCADGILYATDSEAREANEDNTTRGGNGLPPLLLCPTGGLITGLILIEEDRL